MGKDLYVLGEYDIWFMTSSTPYGVVCFCQNEIFAHKKAQPVVRLGFFINLNETDGSRTRNHRIDSPVR